MRNNRLKFCNRKSCQRSGEFQGIFQWRTSLVRSRRVFLHVMLYLTTASIWLLPPKLNLSQMKKLSRMIVAAMHEELHQFTRNDVWFLIPRSDQMNIIGCKWVFRNKLDESRVITRNKARLVDKGYNQEEGIDYGEIFAPVARLEVVRLLLDISWMSGFKLFQMDVKSVFLNGIINEEVYVEQPPGFEDHRHPNHVYKLKKALYRLKQAPRQRYERLCNLYMFILCKVSCKCSSYAFGFIRPNEILNMLEVYQILKLSWSKSMLMTSFLVLPKIVCVKSLWLPCKVCLKCQWWGSFHSFLDCRSRNPKNGIFLS